MEDNNETKMTPLEFLKDTIAFYSADPKGRRSVKEGSTKCLYFGPNGTNCAVGRWIDPRFKDSIMSGVESYNEASVYDLTLKFRGCIVFAATSLSLSVLGDMQLLHDFDDNWDQSGLSEKGEVLAKRLRKKYANELT